MIAEVPSTQPEGLVPLALQIAAMPENCQAAGFEAMVDGEWYEVVVVLERTAILASASGRRVVPRDKLLVRPGAVRWSQRPSTFSKRRWRTQAPADEARRLAIREGSDRRALESQQVAERLEEADRAAEARRRATTRAGHPPRRPAAHDVAGAAPPETPSAMPETLPPASPPSGPSQPLVTAAPAAPPCGRSLAVQAAALVAQVQLLDAEHADLLEENRRLRATLRRARMLAAAGVKALSS